MKKDKIILDFVKLSVPHKVEFGRNVITKRKGNANFKTPDTPVEELEKGTTLLEERYVAALNGSKEAKALLRQAEDAWDDLMRKDANYVNRTADGDDAIILSAGYNLAKQPVPGSRPEFSVELGETSGSVYIRRQSVDGARTYLWQYYKGEIPPANDAEWTNLPLTTKASTEASGLTPLNKYWFRGATVSSSGTSNYCAPVMQVVI